MEKVKKVWEKKMKKKQKEVMASREQKKKIRQRHQEAVKKAWVATPKTEKKQIHKIIEK